MFPAIEPLAHGHLQVSPLHTLYWETVGNPAGTPILFLHGGPGAGCGPHHRQFFNPATSFATLFDQRGCGRSFPVGETRENTTAQLIDDIERLRTHLGVAKWLVFGGSWGSTLALAYGQAHPERCLGFVLRGVYLGTRAETDWFLTQMGKFFPDEGERWLDVLPAQERAAPLSAYVRRMLDPDPSVHGPATAAWTRYESACAFLEPRSYAHDTAFALAIARLEAHYMAHDCFLRPDQLISEISKIAHLPAHIVQGRYDVICPPIVAYNLAKAWPGAKLEIIEVAGHAQFEPGIKAALVKAVAAMQADVGRG